MGVVISATWSSGSRVLGLFCSMILRSGCTSWLEMAMDALGITAPFQARRWRESIKEKQHHSEVSQSTWGSSKARLPPTSHWSLLAARKTVGLAFLIEIITTQNEICFDVSEKKAKGYWIGKQQSRQQSLLRKGAEA